MANHLAKRLICAGLSVCLLAFVLAGCYDHNPDGPQGTPSKGTTTATTPQTTTTHTKPKSTTATTQKGITTHRQNTTTQTKPTTTHKNPITSTSPTTTTTQTAKPTEPKPAVPLYAIAFEGLSANEQALYLTLQQAVLAKQDTMVLAHADLAEVRRAYGCLVADHPEYFWIPNQFPAYERTAKELRLSQMRRYSIEQIDSMQTKIAGAMLIWMQEAPDEDADDYEKAKWVFETVAANTTYDLYAPDHQTPYSVFVNHRSVCSGYAAAAGMLLQRLGVSSSIVVGKVKSANGSMVDHAWNLVRLNDRYYHMDVTLGDAQAGEQSFVDYAYLNLTTAAITRNNHHQILDNPYLLPDCTAMEDSYLVKEGLFFQSADSDILTTAVARQLEKGANQAQLQFAGFSEYQMVKEQLQSGQAIFGVNGLIKSGRADLQTGTYLLQDDLFVVTLLYTPLPEAAATTSAKG